MADGRVLELEAGESCAIEDDSLVCRDAADGEIARFARFEVLVYGRSDVLRTVLRALQSENQTG